LPIVLQFVVQFDIFGSLNPTIYIFASALTKSINGNFKVDDFDRDVGFN
jgi:hypothetical protein